MQALINTVDTIEDFLPRGAYVFKTRSQAISFAARAILNSPFLPTRKPNGRKLNSRELLEEFQMALNPTEFFHIEDAFMKEQEA